MLTVAQVVLCIESLAPPSMALPDDPVGLACGSLEWPAGKIMLALDASEDTVRQASEAGAGLLVTHHPLIFRPLRSVDPRTSVGRALAMSMKAEVAIYSAHTNLDSARQGINSDLAELVGLADTEVLVPGGGDRVKVVTFVPRESLDAVRGGLFEAGAGRVGAYSQASFSSTGQGTFFGEEGAKPAVGSAGRFEKVDEFRIETVADRRDLARILQAVREAHPYEEPVIDVYALIPSGGDSGLGVVGNLPAPVSPRDLARSLVSTLRCRSARVAGDAERKASRVAVCAGSGSSLFRQAAAAGAHIMVTGDVKYHEAREAQCEGLSVIDVGHYAPERLGMERFAARLEAHLRQRGHSPEVVMAREEDPFNPVE